MGKTALSLHHAIHAAQSGYGVLYLSMEMVATELADRAIACIGKVSLGSLLSAKMTEGEWDGVTHTTSKAAKMSLHVLDRSGLTFYQVATYARRHKRKHGLDLLVVDYLQLMAGDDGEKRHSQIEEITRNMKTLAKELGIAILLLSQLSRKTEDVRRPKLSHLRDSGAIEQDADVVLFIHREEMDFPDKVDAKNYADIYIAKNRQGALGRIGATYIGNQVRFENYGGVPKNFDAQPTTERKGYK
jgi:replicative DNA helicase